MRSNKEDKSGSDNLALVSGLRVEGDVAGSEETRSNVTEDSRAIGPLTCNSAIPPSIGIYGFGAAGHIIAQVARHQGREVYAFTRAGDVEGQQFARQQGAVWASDSESLPPVELDAAILFAPVGNLVPQALRAVARGGTVVCGGIHMSDIPSFPYRLLWGERTVRSVANLTRRDGEEFLALAPRVPVRTEIETFRLEDANEALARLRAGRIRGAAVLLPHASPA